MRGLRWLVLAVGLAVAGVSVAQIAPMRIQRPPVALTIPQPSSTTAALPASQLNYQDPDAMKAQISRLKREKRELRVQLQTTLADLQGLRARLDEMTRAGGSLVTAQCVGPALSRNTAGAEENCAASGYACEPVSGLCRRQCNVSTDCAPYFLCDTGAHRCVPPPPPADDE